MARVTLKTTYESFESLMRRFKKAVDKDDVLKDYQKHEFYERPTVARVKAKSAAIKRHQRKLFDEEQELNKIRRPQKQKSSEYQNYKK